MSRSAAHEGYDRPRPTVDVVILTHNDGDLLAEAVTSALASDGTDVTVWVIDNGSDPPAKVGHDPRVHLIRNATNAGVGGGRNQGVRLGSAPLVCLLDSDARLGPGALLRLTEPLTHPTVGIAVPVFVGQLPTESAGIAPTFAVKVARALGRRSTYEPADVPAGASQWDVDFGIGACQMVRRSVFEEVGGIDDSEAFGPEDVDFCLRVRRVGFRVVQVAGADVHHPPRRAHRRLFTRKGLRHSRSVLRHFWRHGLRGRSDSSSARLSRAGGPPQPPIA